jgi:hypothetical protein
MKGQMIPLLFIVLVVSFVLIGYVFYNIFYGISYQGRVFEIHTIDTVRNLIENFKNFLGLSLTYSSQQALREQACSGGTIDMMIDKWICNGPKPVEVDESKQCLEKFTKYYLNVYMEMFNTSLPVDMAEKNYTDCVFGVNSQDVMNGKFDEGDFWVNCSNAKISVTSQRLKESEDLKTEDFVTRNRYWYMFRIFYQWAQADVYSKCICENVGCGCYSGSGEEQCSTCQQASDLCADLALKDLQSRFDALDHNITCEVDQNCCAQGYGPSCLPPSDCLPWDNGLCARPCTHDCRDPKAGEDICPTSPTAKMASKNIGGGPVGFGANKNPFAAASDCICEYWYEGRFAASHVFTCTDIKYYIPSDNGPVPLKFKAAANAYWRDQDVCKTINDCDCTTGEGACCTPCVINPNPPPTTTTTTSPPNPPTTTTMPNPPPTTPTTTSPPPPTSTTIPT